MARGNNPDNQSDNIDLAASSLLKLYPELKTEDQARSYILTRNGRIKGVIEPTSLNFYEVKRKKNLLSIAKKTSGHVKKCLFPDGESIGVGIQREGMLQHAYRALDLCDGDEIYVCLLQHASNTRFTSRVERLLRYSFPNLPWHIEYFPDQDSESNLCEIDNTPKQARLLLFYLDGEDRPLANISEYRFTISNNQNAIRIVVTRPETPECFLWILIETETGHFQSRTVWVHTKLEFLRRYGNISINQGDDYTDMHPARLYSRTNIKIRPENDMETTITIFLYQYLIQHMGYESDEITDKMVEGAKIQLDDKYGFALSDDDIRGVMNKIMAGESCLHRMDDRQMEDEMDSPTLNYSLRDSKAYT